MKAEGWYHDPFGRHEARWFSDGTPTDLVRDGGVEARDTPPPDPPQGPLVPWEVNATEKPGDGLRRADSLEEGGSTDNLTKEEISKVVRVMLNPGDSDYW
jgi:hypothetical protein